MDTLEKINGENYKKAHIETVYYGDDENKEAWGKAGLKAIRQLAKDCGAVAVNLSFNRSGSIDRGYVSGFIVKKDGTKTVYISINDGMRDILYRTAKHAKDYEGGSNNTREINRQGFNDIAAFISKYFVN